MDWQAIWDWIWVDPIVRIPVVGAGVAILAAALGAMISRFMVIPRITGNLARI
jgi:hypothetical protein